MGFFLRSMEIEQTASTTLNEDVIAYIDWGNNIINNIVARGPSTLHDAIKNGHLFLVKIATTKQLVDIMTKGIKLPPWEMRINGLLVKTLKPSKSVVAH